MSDSAANPLSQMPEFIPVPPLEGGGNETPSCRSSPAGKSKRLQKKSKDRWSDIVKIYNSKGKKLALPEPSCSSPPWCRTNTTYVQDIIGLHGEIEDFYDYMKPTETEHKLRLIVFERVKQVILELWPAAIVDFFGSFATDLYLPSSDIDVVVIGKWEQLPLRTLEQAFRSADFAEKDSIRVIDKASVPIVKIVDSDTKIRVDISFNVTNGVQNAVMINSFINEFPSLPKLAYVLKQFLVQRDLNEVFTGGLGSYCLVLMIVSFLQLHYSRDTRRKNQNLGVLLIEFFELYGRHFNYINTGIRIRNGGRYMPKDQLFPTAQASPDDGYRPPLLSLEDPLQPTNDIGKSSYGILKVKQAFEVAFITLSKAVLKPKQFVRYQPQGTLLSLIITVPEETVRHRQWVENRFRNSDIVASFQEQQVVELGGAGEQQQQRIDDNEWVSSDLSLDDC